MGTTENHSDPALVWSPQRGGMASQHIRYPGFDRHDSTSLNLLPGDTCWRRLQIGDIIRLSPHGERSLFRIAALDDHNRSGLHSLGISAPTTSLSQQSLLAFDNREIAARLRARNLSFDDVEFTELSGHATGDIVLRADEVCVVILVSLELSAKLVFGADYARLQIEHQMSASSVPELPEPLAAVREEFRVDRGSALAYEVREGEIVQIIDVEGRQCSDFMAMNAEQLSHGQERFIDSAVSRTMTRGAYPLPGLFDKFFDQDMMPLLAVVQDTVGRHDTFALACTARGYEERGFPGHLNCSDNISDAYDRWGIQRRRAWPAINFFFNSWIHPGDNRIQVDEAWSRAGDYVAMRALRDLVCVSTACPDDVDPINGWNPTDIHVRIYRNNSPVRRAIAYRPTADAESVMTKESPFHERTSELTHRFSVSRDVWSADQYDASGVIEEYWACRNACTLQDMSSLRKLDIAGPDSERLLQTVLSRDVSKIAVNRGVYALILDEQGSVIDDGTLFRLADDLFRWCCGNDESAIRLKDAADSHALRVWIRDVSASLANLAVQGPKSRDILDELVFTQPTQPRLSNVRWFGFAVGRVGDRNGVPLMVTRTGYTGELGYEIFCDRRDALTVWDAVVQVGSNRGLTPMGTQALELLRVEAGLMAQGAEFGPHCDADESGLGFAVDVSKADFTGREAIIRNRQAPRRCLVGLLLDGEEVPIHGDPVFIERREVGVVTSAVRSPELGRVIAMCRLSVEARDRCSRGEALIEIGKLDGHRKRLSCQLTSVPFIDPERRKARA